MNKYLANNGDAAPMADDGQPANDFRVGGMVVWSSWQVEPFVSRRNILQYIQCQSGKLFNEPMFMNE